LENQWLLGTTILGNPHIVSYAANLTGKPGKHRYLATLNLQGLLPPLPPQSGPSNYPQDEPEDVEVEEQEVGPGFLFVTGLI